MQGIHLSLSKPGEEGVRWLFCTDPVKINCKKAHMGQEYGQEICQTITLFVSLFGVKKSLISTFLCLLFSIFYTLISSLVYLLELEMAFSAANSVASQPSCPPLTLCPSVPISSSKERKCDWPLVSHPPLAQLVEVKLNYYKQSCPSSSLV